MIKRIGVVKILFFFVFITLTFLLGRATQSFQFNLYLKQNTLDYKDQNNKLNTCQIELIKTIEEKQSLEKESNELFSVHEKVYNCVEEYYRSFDITNYSRKYTIDDIVKIEECL